MSVFGNVKRCIRANDETMTTPNGGSGRCENDLRARGAIATLKHRVLLTAILVAATALYSFNIRRTLGASEAYSALAAFQPTVQQVTDTALTLDPGKPVLYHLSLHWFSRVFGNSEASLRSMSVLFALASLSLVFLVADELFGPAAAMAAALIWAFNPLAILFAQWARMYSMFIALALAHLLFMAKVRRAPTPTRIVVCGLLGAAMLYTHLGGVLILAAEGAIIVRDFWLYRTSNLWLPVLIALALFSPFLPIAVSQSSALLFGHWLDWIGAQPNGSSIGIKSICALPLCIVALWLVFAPEARDARSESSRRCATIALMPIMAMIASSVLIRPMFQVRYLAPCWALAAILLGYALDSFGTRWCRLSVVGIVGFFLALTPMYERGRNDPWHDIAHMIEMSSKSSEPVVFEAGFFGPDHFIEGPANGFPMGYYRVPFDFYFRANNPQTVVPGSDPVRARSLISQELEKSGSLWLISGKRKVEALREVPGLPDVRVISEVDYKDVLLLHLERTRISFPNSAPPFPVHLQLSFNPPDINSSRRRTGGFH